MRLDRAFLNIQVTTGVTGVYRAGGLDKEELAVGLRKGAVLNPTRDDEDFSRAEADLAVAQLDR